MTCEWPHSGESLRAAFEHAGATLREGVVVAMFVGELAAWEHGVPLHARDEELEFATRHPVRETALARDLDRDTNRSGARRAPGVPGWMPPIVK